MQGTERAGGRKNVWHYSYLFAKPEGTKRLG